MAKIEKDKSKQRRLPVRYLDDEVLLTDTHAWTWLRLPLTAYEFLPYSAREGIAQQITMALAGLVINNNEPVDVHLRVVTKPFNTIDWFQNLRNKVSGWDPAPGWGDYSRGIVQHVHNSSFATKEVYLGVCLGPRKGKGAPQISSVKNDLIGPLKNLTTMIEGLTGVSDDAVDPRELSHWNDRAWDVRRSLANSHLKAIPASSTQVAWLIMRPFWPEMPQPHPSSSPSSVWGAGELRQLVEGVVTNHRRYVEVEQVDLMGNTRKAYAINLAFARFPDVFYFPDQEPWMHFAASQGFTVDFSSRMQIVPAMKVQKDVGRKLADAKDQAQHIAESGTSVPLKVREQLEVATVLEYTIDKDRMPWLYGRHRLTVTGATPEEVSARAKTIIESYRDLGIDLAWPTGDQLELLVESIPGGSVKAKSYYQRQELGMISGAMPTASAEVGDFVADDNSWRGPYLGQTTSRVRTPVFFSPHVAMARNAPPGVAITGAPGGGKSFLAFTLAHQMAIQGVWTIYIDPKADAKPMGQLPGLGNPKVFDLRHGNDGMLDPFALGDSSSEARLQALETLRLLLGGAVSEEREEALLQAVEVVGSGPEPSLSKVVDVLLSNTQLTGARNLGQVLKTIRELPFARLCFSPKGGMALRPEDGLTVVTLLGLDLPPADMKPDDYSYENRLAVSVMYLLTRYARRLMLSLDKSHPKAICIDEAWAITSTPQGAKLIPEIARMGRSHNTALVLVSQNAGDLMKESVTNSISTKFAFRSTIPGEIDDVLDLFGMDKSQGYQPAIRDLRNGECLMQDVDGRISRVQVDRWNPELFAAFDTNPETRGKTGAA